MLIICPVADLFSGVGNFGAPPLGPWRLAHYLRHYGQHVDVWDSNVTTSLRLPSPEDHLGRDRAEALAEAFLASIAADHDLASYDFIGFSILSDTLPSTLGLIELVHQRYCAGRPLNARPKLVAGNHEATVNLQDCVGKSHLDGVILGDAEEPMLALLRGAPPHEVPGVLWRTHNPKPTREQFEEWNDLIQWGQIPYEAYWERTKQLYDWSKMTEAERLQKLYEVHTVRIHTIVACELACTYSVAGDTIVYTREGPIEIAKLAMGACIGMGVNAHNGEHVISHYCHHEVLTPEGYRKAPQVLDEGVMPVYRVTLLDGTSIKATAEHRFLGPGGWVEVKDLKPGVSRLFVHCREEVVPMNVGVIGSSGAGKTTLAEALVARRPLLDSRTVVSVEECLSERVYDLTVPDGEAFVANGFVAHNCSVANTRRIASGSTKPSITNLSSSALERNLLAIKAQVPRVMTIYDSSDEAWLGRGRAEEYLDVLERVRPVMDEGLPKGMRYLIQCRTNDLTEEIIDRAARVGVRHLTIGVESPIERVRKDIKKPQREEHIRDVIRWGVPRDIDVYMLFIMFLPSITLEELHVAVEHWRIYMALGATCSVEPFCMSYLGTALHDDPHYITEHVGYTIPFSGGKKLKWATLIWPEDRRVCAVLQWFRSHVDDFIERARQKAGHKHTFKGFTGKITIDCLEEALRLYDAGQIPPWEPGEGCRSMVYQDYGDQLSGSEIARAASMDRKNTTASRFNSTHSLLDAQAPSSKIDDPNAGIRGRVKDPALPHEMALSLPTRTEGVDHGD